MLAFAKRVLVSSVQKGSGFLCKKRVLVPSVCEKGSGLE
jgi:hypothetical protein